MVSTSISALASLASLNQAMAIQLRAQSPHPGLTVNCLEHQGRLLLLGHHRAPEVRDVAHVFHALEQHLYLALATVSPEASPWEGQSFIPVRLYLKLRAAHRPYAMHTFTWRLDQTAARIFPPDMPAAASELSPAGHTVLSPNLDSGIPASEIPASELPASELPASEVPNSELPGTEIPASGIPASEISNSEISNSEISNSEISNSEISNSEISNSELPGTEIPGTELTHPDLPAAAPVAESLALALWGDPHATTAPGAPATPGADSPGADSPGGNILGVPRQWLRDYWSYGVAGLILVASGVFALALTRPCVVGRCERLAQAQTHYERANVALALAPSPTDLASAQADLQNAIDRLTPIPVWSGAYSAAQADLQRYRQGQRAVQAILQAQATATQAAALSQNPPHTVERWVTIHQLWQRAIDQLETVPATSPAYDYAQKKRSEYRANHSAIGRRIVAEEEAEANFNTAIQTGFLAQQRMDTANSLAGWQLATKEWQAAIKGLSLIPQGTMIYDQAQAQRQDYQQHLHRTTHQSHLETVGAHNYDQAIRAARAAAAYEAQGQWSLAVNHWQRAVASAQQIPTGTILADEGARLMEAYEPSLLNAQDRLRGAVALQTLTTTLGTLCSEADGTCTVREDPTQVRITLANQYAEPLRRAITPPAADGSVAFTQTLTTQTQALMEQVITLSHQVNRPVAIYDSQGSFVARYRPDVGGFVRN